MSTVFSRHIRNNEFRPQDVTKLHRKKRRLNINSIMTLDALAFDKRDCLLFFFLRDFQRVYRAASEGSWLIDLLYLRYNLIPSEMILPALQECSFYRILQTFSFYLHIN